MHVAGNRQTAGKIIALDLAPFALAINARRLVNVHDGSPASTLHQDQPGTSVVRTPAGPIAALDLHWILQRDSGANSGPDQSHPDSRLLVVVDRRPVISNELVRQQDRDPIGLFVDSASRPIGLNPSSCHAIPDWVSATFDLPMARWVVDGDGDQRVVRSIIETQRLGRQSGTTHDPVQAADMLPRDDLETLPQDSFVPKSPAIRGGRGLLIFSPAEVQRSGLTTSLALPMACVLSVGVPQKIWPLASGDPDLVGVTLFGGNPVPVLWLGQRLGMPRDADIRAAALATCGDNSRQQLNTGFRMLILRTPEGRSVACLTDGQMRFRRQINSSGRQGDCKIASQWLHGAFLSDDGPIAVPDLDRVLCGSAIDPTVPC
ncbi:MAG: hypothetical protein AAF958_13445 [Planctomycetota bacterium]